MALDEDLRTIFGERLLFAHVAGSVARGTATAQSDIDLFVCVTDYTPRQEAAFRELYRKMHAESDRQFDEHYPGELVRHADLLERLALATREQPVRTIPTAALYDGIVWSGMLSGPRIDTIGSVDQELVQRARNNVSRWNKHLFGIDDPQHTDALRNTIQFKDRRAIKERASHLRENIALHKDELIRILTRYESHETALDELWRSDDALANIHLEEEYLLNGHVQYISAFLPVNLPLYSSVLFGAIPAMMSERTFVKAPSSATDVFTQIFDTLHKNNPNMQLVVGSRGNFLKTYAKNSDVILFTGMYPNAERIKRECPTGLLLYNGAGINPIVVTASANLDEAARAIAHTRLFNSGQDCAGPDAILVDASVEKDFLARLEHIVRGARVGDYADSANTIGQLINPNEPVISGAVFAEARANILHGGQLDVHKRIVHPTIIRQPLSEYMNYREFFAPILWVSSYANEQELAAYFQRPEYTDFAMYASVFGDDTIARLIPLSTILHNKTVLDVERGNLPYGGYGSKANFVDDGKTRQSRPILISREIAQWVKSR